MTIEVHLEKVLADRGMTLTELSNAVGMTMANLSILKTGKARAVRFTTLDALCSVLECQPGDLLSHTNAATDGPRRSGYRSDDPGRLRR